MRDKNVKLLLIGLDGAMPGLLKKFSEEGEVPCLTQLMREGVSLELLPSPPCDTPTNWTTIVTGAWTGTHGATGFNVHLPGESLSLGVRSGFDTRLCGAEFLWDVAEKKGLKSLLYDYPPSRPPTIKNGIVLGGWFNSGRVGSGIGSFHMPEFEKVLPYPGQLQMNSKGDDNQLFTTAIPLPKGSYSNAKETVERAEGTCNRFVKALQYLKKYHNWEVLFSHLHLLDYLSHQILNDIWEQHPDYTPKRGEKGWSVMRDAYHLLDRTISRVIDEFADEKTVICVISDHGAVPSSRLVWPGSALEKVGLIKFLKDGDNYRIDPLASKAAFYFSPPEYIWVNLKGREPDGIVEPGGEYEEVCSQIISALLDIRDPENGKCPFSLVIRKEQAGFLGQWGDRCGDVICFTEPEYALLDFGMADHGIIGGMKELLEMGDLQIGGDTRQGSHHGHLPTHKISPFSISGVGIISGPGVRSGYFRPKPVQMVDIAPTLSHLLDWPKPAQAEGGLLWDILK